MIALDVNFDHVGYLIFFCVSHCMLNLTTFEMFASVLSDVGSINNWHNVSHINDFFISADVVLSCARSDLATTKQWISRWQDRGYVLEKKTLPISHTLLLSRSILSLYKDNANFPHLFVIFRALH